MKLHRVLSVATLLGLLLLVGCSGERDRVSVPPPADNDVLVGTETIGSGGGTITGDEVVVTVPAGAFAADHPLKIYHSGDNQPFGSAAVSRLYRLDGLPAVLNLPLQIRFPVAGKDSGSLIALGETSFSNSANGLVTGYRVLETTYTDSTAVAVIPAASDPADDGGEGLSVHLVNLAGYSTKSGSSGYATLTSVSSHFKISYPLGYSVQAANLGTYLESAYNGILGWGFSYSARTSWPVAVTICDLDDHVFGYQVPSAWGDNHTSLEFNTKRINESTELKVSAGHEFFHLVQALYDNRNRYSKSKSASDRYWLDEAFSVWSEREWSGDPTFLSSKSRDGHARLPFYRFHVPSNGDRPDYHGYGMSALIAYIRDHTLGTTISQIYDNIHANGNDPVAAINSTLSSVISESFGEWHPKFQQELIQGDLYSDVNIATAVAYDTYTWDIKTPQDNHKTLTYEYAAGSSRFYIIDLNNPSFTPQATLTADLDPPTGTLTVYKGHGGSITKLGSGDSMDVEHLDQMAAANDYLMIMVTNSILGPNYDYNTEMALELNIVNPLNFNKGVIYLSGTGSYEVVSTDPDTTYTETRLSRLMGGPHNLSDLADGEFSGDTFTASYNSISSGGDVHIGSISITVNDPGDPTMVTGFMVSGTARDIWGLQEFSFSGDCAVPLLSNENQTYEFVLQSGAPDCLSRVADVFTRTDETSTRTLTELSDGYLQVTLSF